MIIAGTIVAALAALLHVYIFYMESIAWTGAKARATFGTTEEEAQVTKSLAFNQGFYNLFLAIAVFLGMIFLSSGAREVGATLMIVGVASMGAAALVLLLSSPDKRGAAIKQGVLPFFAVVLLALGFAL